MALDNKKEKPKEKPAGWEFDAVEGIVILLFLMAILGALATALGNFFSGNFSFYGFKISGLFNFFKNHSQFFKTIGFVTAGGAAIGTFVFNKLADVIWRSEKVKLYPDPKDMQISASAQSAPNPMATKWQKIVKLSESTNQSDWRLAIIEADIILDELLQKLQLPGDTMGEKLKAVEKSDFNTIDSAWEAHKARNMVAHNGSDFLINQREIYHIISLYESVFKEFFLI